MSILRSAHALILLTLPIGGLAWCGVCDNAPSRSWSWLFGFGECKCHDNWSDRCCSTWSVGDWSVKVSEWRRGQSCEAQPKQACAKVSNSPTAPTYTQQWKHEPSASISSQSQCEQEGCMWVQCFEEASGTLNTPSSNPADMCSNCEGPWKGKCQWDHYEPGFLAFAGPGEYCGFKYPVCPASKAKNCFCGTAAIQELQAGWCNNGAGMGTFCPNAIDHGGGRTQQCSWNGWTISPQPGGDPEETCNIWGI